MQTHLKGFGLENFRVFKDYTWFDFAPITILTGPNSSGKSSLNKALLLLKDNFEKGNLPPYYTYMGDYTINTPNIFNTRDGEFEGEFKEEHHAHYVANNLQFNGKSHELGNLYLTKCRSSDSEIMSFTIPYIININRSFSWDEVEEIFDEPLIPDAKFIKNSIENGFTDSEKIKNEFIENIRTNKGIIERLKVFNQFKSSGKRTVLCHYTFKVDKDASSLTQLELKTDKKITFLKIDETSIFFDLEIYDSLVDNLEHRLLNKFESYEKFIYANYQIDLSYWFLKNGFDKKAAQQSAKRVLAILEISLNEHKSIIRYDIDSMKSSLMESYTLSTNKFIQKNAYGEDDDSDFKAKLRSLNDAQNEGFKFESFLKKSAQLFGLPNKLDFKYNEEQESFFPSIDGHSLKNFGYGLSLLSNLIFKIIEVGVKKYGEPGPDGERYPSGRTSLLILEEPETNLHPKFQSLLADFLIEAANTFKIQFIIETHSEYLIRKLQYLTAKKMIKPDDSIIYYFYDPNNIPTGEEQVRRIEIREDGSLSADFGTGFFDIADNIAISIFNLKKHDN